MVLGHSCSIFERPSAVGFYLCAQAHHTEDVALARSLWCLRMTSEIRNLHALRL